MLSINNKNSIAFTGYYGMSNFGDDIFGAVSVWGAREFWGIQAKILAPSIDGIEAEYSVPDWFSKNVYASPKILGQLSRLGFVLKELPKTEQLIFAGGSLFTATNSGVMKVIEKIANKTDLRLSAIGVSVGPFTNAKDAYDVKSFLAKFDYLSVRDQASYLEVKKFNPDSNVVMAGDLAALYPAAHKIHRENKSVLHPVIGIALCNYESIVGGHPATEENRNNALINAVVMSAKKNGARVRVFSLNNHRVYGDNELANRLVSELEKANISCEKVHYGLQSLHEVWRQIASCNAFVSVRLHGAIAAYLCDVPFVLIEYHQKCRDFLDDIGQKECLRIKNDIRDPSDVSDVIDDLLLNPHKPEIASVDYSKRAYQHFSAASWAQHSRSETCF
nr:polysaccharide pyruvyl transferase family protein [uncultured Methylophaga sp.]